MVSTQTSSLCVSIACFKFLFDSGGLRDLDMQAGLGTLVAWKLSSFGILTSL